MDAAATAFMCNMVLPGLIGKCIDVATNSGIDGWKKHAAIGNTLNQFLTQFKDDKKIIDQSFKKWVTSNEFQADLKKLEPPYSFEPLVESFKRITGIQVSPTSDFGLDELIEAFLIELTIQLEIVDPRARIKAERAQLLAIHTTINTAIGGAVTELKAAISAHIQVPTGLSNTQNLSSSASAISYEMQELEERLVDEVEVHSLIDGAIEHIKRGRVNGAVHQLMDIREQLSKLPSSSPYIRSRVAGNLGACFVRLNSPEKAEEEFQKSLILKPSRLTYSNLALAMLLRDKISSALESSQLAMAYPKKNGRTIAIHMQVLYFAKKRDELEELIAAHDALCNADPDCILARAQIDYHDQQFESARILYEKVAQKCPYDSEFPLLSADCILKTIETKYQNSPPVDGRLSSEDLEKLKVTQTLIDNSLILMEGNDYTNSKLRALELQVSLDFLQGNFTEAEAHCQAMIEIAPEHQTALLKMGCLALLLRADNSQAINYFEKVEPKYLEPVAVMTIRPYFELGRFEEAKAMLLKFETLTNRKNLWYVYAYEKLRIADALGETESAIVELFEQYPDNGDVFYAIAEFHNRKGNTQLALEFLGKAEKAETCSLKLHIPRLKAEIYIDAKLWSAAVKTYETFPNLEGSERDLFKYLAALANDNMLASAGVEAKKARLRNEGRVIPGITEIEAASNLFKLENPKAALILILEVLKVEPSSNAQELLIKANRALGRQPTDLSDP